ncbi:MAG: ABC transporter permease subunit [Roseimicrobium sp.]
MTPRRLGLLLCLIAVASAACRWLSLHIPFLKIPFLAFAAVPFKEAPLLNYRWTSWIFSNDLLGNLSIGWLFLALLFVTGAWLIFRGKNAWQFSPLAVKQFRRFRSVRRGYISFLLLAGLLGIACLDNLLVGKRALVVSYEGKWHFPFVHDVIPGTKFGLKYDAETNYRELKEVFRLEGKGNWVLMPPVPYDAKLDTPETKEVLEIREGKVFSVRTGKLFNGRAYTVFRGTLEQKRQEWVYRSGVRHGEMRGWDAQGEQVEKGRFEDGKRVQYTDYSEGKAPALEPEAGESLITVVYPPSPPSWMHSHFLGTNSQGGDVLAILFGGGQQAAAASFLFLVAVFGIGVIVGGTLGYFGGWYDLMGQRLMEIWSSLPFLFVVVIVSSLINPTLVVLVGIIALFSWMGTTTYIRTAAFKEKARDYVSAARLVGASTGRVIFKHILPNSIAILVTLAPFEIALVINSLAALDFLGFGLPPEEPSWGRLLREGTENFVYPWIVSAAFFALVVVLLLVTFVGEAVREAFDPKKFTIYE